MIKEDLANVYSYNLGRDETFDKVVFLDNKIIAYYSGYTSMNLYHSGKVFYLQILCFFIKSGLGKVIHNNI